VTYLIIINGDDFGMNRRCSTAIAAAFDKELITDTTMMANGDCFEYAVALAREKGFSDRIGIHFNLTEGTPLTKGITELRDFVSDGRFHKGFLSAPRLLNEAERIAVSAELSAQAERLISSGIRITHADSHHYIHNNIYLAELIAKVCAKHSIDMIRLSRTFDTPERPRVTENIIDNRWWREQGFKTTESFGRMSDVIGKEPTDDTEIMVHPDFDRNGVLIDRTGFVDGFPVGESLSALSAGLGAVKVCYSDLRQTNNSKKFRFR